MHVKRYTDTRLDILEGVAFVEQIFSGLNITAAREYVKIRDEWLCFVKNNNATTEAALEDYFGCLLAGITSDGILMLPRTGRGYCHTIPLDA